MKFLALTLALAMVSLSFGACKHRCKKHACATSAKSVVYQAAPYGK